MYRTKETPVFQEETNVHQQAFTQTVGGFIDYKIHIQDIVYTPIEKYNIMLEQVFHSRNVSREASHAIRHITNMMLKDNLGNYN